MQTIICVKCKDCRRLATTDMKWVEVAGDGPARKDLYCACGGKEWIFTEMAATMIGPDVLVINKEMRHIKT